jgi:hypothetical protein
MTPGNLDPDAPGFADAVAAVVWDRSAWPAGERAAPGRVVARGAAPLIRMRRWHIAAGEFTFVIERARDGVYSFGAGSAWRSGSMHHSVCHASSEFTRDDDVGLVGSYAR